MSEAIHIRVQKPKLNDKSEFDDLIKYIIDNDPIYFYKTIISFAKKHLNKNGVIYFEINQNYVDQITSLIYEFDFKITKDFYGQNRFVTIKNVF